MKCDEVIRYYHDELDGMARALCSALKQLNAERGSVVYLKAPDDVSVSDLSMMDHLDDGTRVYYVTEGVDGDD